MKTITTLKTTELKFKLGQEFVEETADGRKCNTTFTRNGNTLTQTQKLDDITTTISREFGGAPGAEMKTVFSSGGVVSTRVYKKA